MRRRLVLACCGLATALGGCSTTVWTPRTPAAERREQYLHYAGPPVDSFTYLTDSYAFTTIGNYQLVLWTTINDAYLITVMPPCVGLDFARGIRLTQTANRVTRGVDKILFQDQICFISQLRPVDYLAMKREVHPPPPP
jgi:Family of unknown function (DUF6491)